MDGIASREVSVSGGEDMNASAEKQWALTRGTISPSSLLALLSEIARSLFRLARARRYQNSMREFVTVSREGSTLKNFLNYSDVRT